jgi:hypothetical protein
LTAAVFGDFLGAGRAHLTEAAATGERQSADLPAVVASLHRLVGIMSVYLEDLAPGTEIEADVRVWEGAIAGAGAALSVAAGCLHRSALYLGPGEPWHESDPSPAHHLADAATGLAAGWDLLHTHIVVARDGLVQERSEWAPVVTSLPVTRALATEIGAWSARLASYTGWLAGSAAPQRTTRRTGPLGVVLPREELAIASQCLRAANAALRPAQDADPAPPADTELLCAIPAAFPPPRQPLGSAAESVAELCAGITVSASRLRAAAYHGRDRGRWSPEVTSGGWQWMAQAAAVTSHLGELALRALAPRAGQLKGLAVTRARVDGTAEALTGMRTAWQQVDLMWNSIVTEQRLLPTPAMSEANDLLLRMGRLVWDNPQWTPARASRAPPPGPRCSGVRDTGVRRRGVGRPSGG